MYVKKINFDRKVSSNFLNDLCAINETALLQ